MIEYSQVIERFRVMKKEEFNSQTIAEMKINGIDPDNYLALIESYSNREEAVNCVNEYTKNLQKYAPQSKTEYFVVDAGTAEYMKFVSALDG